MRPWARRKRADPTVPATIESAVLGSLARSEKFEDWWHSAPVAVPFLGGLKLAVTFTEYLPDEDPAFSSEADAAMTAFLSKPETERTALAPLVLANYAEFAEEVDLDWMPEPTAGNIWEYVHPQAIYVSRRDYCDKDVYVQLACECDWEQEHGLQLVYRRGEKATRVSDQDGHLTEADAYDKPDEEDELLSRF